MRYLVLLVGATIGCGGDKSSSVDANPDAPTCVISGPANNATTGFDVPITLAATANDPQDGALMGASVVWKTSLQVQPLGSGTTLMTVLPVGSNAITCTATDSTGLTGTATVTVASKSPYAKINHPGDNEVRPQNQAVPFVGYGRDKEDVDLIGPALAWASNLSGPIGTGASLNQVLPAGVHTITLTATDSASNTDSTSITLT